MTTLLKSIVDEFICRDDCEICLGEGIVCEDHPGRPWAPGPLHDSDSRCCDCGAGGMPCPGGYP